MKKDILKKRNLSHNGKKAEGEKERSFSLPGRFKRAKSKP